MGLLLGPALRLGRLLVRRAALGEAEGQRFRRANVRLLGRPAAIGRSDLGFLGPGPLSPWTPQNQGLEKLGFPWILSSEIETYQWVTRDPPRKKFRRPLSLGGRRRNGGSGGRERRNRRSRGEDRSWGELSAGFWFSARDCRATRSCRNCGSKHPPPPFAFGRLDQSAGLGRSRSRKTPKRGDDGRGSRDSRPRDELPQSRRNASASGAEASNSRKA